MVDGSEYYVVGKASFPGSSQTGNEAMVGSYQTLHRPQGGVCLKTHLTAAVKVCWCTVRSPSSTLMQCLGAENDGQQLVPRNDSSIPRNGLTSKK